MRTRDVARLIAGAIVCAAALAWLDSPLRPSATRRLQMLGIAPQGWGFFSSPRSETFEVFRWSKGAWTRVDAPLAAAVNLFGLRRTTVNHGAEFRTLVDQVETHWNTAVLRPEQLPTADVDTVMVRNLAREPRLCGEVLLVQRPPLPWAWAHSRASVALPTRFARLDVRC
jgi:antimicrobial peptide system SdpA family protein